MNLEAREATVRGGLPTPAADRNIITGFIQVMKSGVAREITLKEQPVESGIVSLTHG